MWPWFDGQGLIPITLTPRGAPHIPQAPTDSRLWGQDLPELFGVSVTDPLTALLKMCWRRKAVITWEFLFFNNYFKLIWQTSPQKLSAVSSIIPRLAVVVVGFLKRAKLVLGFVDLLGLFSIKYLFKYCQMYRLI